MRSGIVVLSLVGAVAALAGCIDGSDTDVEPEIAVSKYQTNDDLSWRIDWVSNAIKDWSDLEISGCEAPTEGPLDAPHMLTECSGPLEIRFAETGALLFPS